MGPKAMVGSGSPSTRPDLAPVHSSPGGLCHAGLRDLNVSAEMSKQDLVTQIEVEQDLQLEQPQNQPKQAEPSSLQLPENEAGRFGRQSLDGSVLAVDATQRVLHGPDVKHIVHQKVASGVQDDGKVQQIRSDMFLSALQKCLDKDKYMELESEYAKFKSNKVNRDDFLKAARIIVGDQMLKEVPWNVQLPTTNAPAQRNNPADISQHSLFSHVSTQQIPSSSVSGWPTDQQTCGRGTKNATSPLTIGSPPLSQSNKRARIAADNSKAGTTATQPVLGKEAQDVGSGISKKDANTSSARAHGGASASGEPHTGQVRGQKPRLPSSSKMLQRHFSTDHMSDSATDRATAFAASQNTLLYQYVELLHEVQQLQHELAAEKKNTLRLELEKTEKAGAHSVEVTQLKRQLATLATRYKELNITVRLAQEEASTARTSTAALHLKLAEVFRSLNASMEQLEMKVDPPLVQSSEGYADSLVLLAEKFHVFISSSAKR